MALLKLERKKVLKEPTWKKYGVEGPFIKTETRVDGTYLKSDSGV